MEEILIGAALYNRWGIWRCNYQSSLVQRERYIARRLYRFIPFRSLSFIQIGAFVFFYQAADKLEFAHHVLEIDCLPPVNDHLL